MLEGRFFEERGLERADDLTRVAQLLGDTAAASSRSPDSLSCFLFHQIERWQRLGVPQIETWTYLWESDHSLEMYQRK